MRIQQIHVEGFGTLSQCRISGLSEGLSVIHGVNGSGKTTLMHFLTGVLSGYDKARKAKLLPPLKQGTPGGSVTLRNEAGRFEVIRHARSGHSDTLAISLLQGTANDVSDLRKRLKEIPEHVLTTLYAVTGNGALDLAGLVEFAREQGIDLGSRSNAGAWLSAKIRDMEAERAELFRTAPTQGSLVSLEQERDRVARELAATRQLQAQQLAAWQHSLQALRKRIETLIARGTWQDGELQAVETDLTETQDRLWSTRETKVQDVETVARPTPVVEADWIAKLSAIDQEIAHIQQVLRDLAASRMTLSMSKAELAGADIPDFESTLQRQRKSLSAIESQTTNLSLILAHLQQSAACMCGPQSAHLQAGIDVIREQVWLICQELGRQTSAHQHDLLQSQREGVDRCEHELVRQVQRLRLRREEILQQRGRKPADRVHHRTLHEAAGCQCDGHDEAVSQWQDRTAETPVAQQVIVRERTVITSAARPGDQQLEVNLLAKRAAFRGQRAETTEQLRLARLELQQLLWAAKEFSGDRTAQDLQNEFTLIEQQLADAREQWQSLTLLQTVLLRTQQKLNADAISPVIAEASKFLNQMTEGRYPRMRWNSNSGELLVVNSADGELPAQALSRGTLEQAVLSFRLALCREFQRRGTELPLILDDVLADSDEDRLKAAVDVLCEFAQSHQILFLTCQEHLVNLFSSRSAVVLALPGTPWVSSRHELPSISSSQATRETVSPDASATISQLTRDRIQPDEPFWLQTASSISHVPSLGEQMARRLGALGVRNVGELVELDPENVEMPLDSLQISAKTLRLWQAEARLLCCVPGLNGRDAQLLTRCGILSPGELAECDAATLSNRVAQLRSRSAGDYEVQWLSQQPDWPTRSQLESWVRGGRAARSWKAAREWSEGRKIHMRHQNARPRKRMIQPAAVVEPTSHVRLHSQSESEGAESTWKFYLQFDSPIVDAPSIGPRMAERLNAIGVERVSHLLAARPTELAQRLNRRDVTPENVLAWQQQANLMCRVPQLRGHDVQVLVTCKITDPETLAAMSPTQLFALVEPFVNSRDGVRMLRSSRVPDLAEVTDWINFARQSPSLKAA
ncbi:DUF4332 domain-containing protein [Planctomicrobium sp. SH661]|uniref:DUF4332 domain-containing protein n=1 Tax=Planctomicrobium sp. SH661 TaxID=3448124 RepID=UPI003F5CB821